jgi:hypothetical protein
MVALKSVINIETINAKITRKRCGGSADSAFGDSFKMVAAISHPQQQYAGSGRFFP